MALKWHSVCRCDVKTHNISGEFEMWSKCQGITSLLAHMFIANGVSYIKPNPNWSAAQLFCTCHWIHVSYKNLLFSRHLSPCPSPVCLLFAQNWKVIKIFRGEIVEMSDYDSWSSWR